jgi:hypothetical protein
LSVSPTHGEQEMSIWNGHYQSTCYHPLFVFNQFGDLERCALRPGNVHSADGWEDGDCGWPPQARLFQRNENRRGRTKRVTVRAEIGRSGLQGMGEHDFVALT